MSQNQSRKNIQRPEVWSRWNRTVVVTTLVLCVVGTILAQVNSRKKGKRTSGEVSTMSLSASSPSKEYIYAGSKLVATIEPTAVNGNDAQFVSMCAQEDFASPPTCVPIGTGSPFGDPSQTYRVFVTMRNTGTSTWTAAGGYKLGSQNPANNNTWGLTRANLSASVAPTQLVTFTFGAKKPAQGNGYFNFQWQMVQDGGVGYFGERTNNGIVPAGAWLPQGSTPNYATFVSQSVPTEMVGDGSLYVVSITMHNAGTNWWVPSGGSQEFSKRGGVKTQSVGISCSLGAQSPQDNMTWGLNRIPLPSSPDPEMPPMIVYPGQDVTFYFGLTAPSTPGQYTLQWMMVEETQGQWFGTLTPTTLVNVTSP